ncbi:AUGMIN subunit 3 [Orobanche gracilis]
MSGGRLCGLLAELGYEGHGSSDPDSFEWPFQYEDVRPILDWLCSSLRPSNVLSLSELSQYEQFLQEGKLLEGEDLEFAYDSISTFSARKDNQEAVFGTEGRKAIRSKKDEPHHMFDRGNKEDEVLVSSKKDEPHHMFDRGNKEDE